MANRFKSEYRYFVRWRVDPEKGGHLLLRGWDVCDRNTFKIVATFMSHEKAQAEAICKLLNSNEEVELGLSM